MLWFAVFLGAFVFFEPAPYELFLALAIPAWALSNPTLPRTIAPLLTLMLVFLAGGLLSATQAKDIGAQPIYYAVTGFLALSSCFYAAVLGTDPRLYRVVINAWIVGACLTVVLGVIGYFGLSGGLFTKFDRAAGGFQDPNVFGPFLAFPFVILVRRVADAPARQRALQRRGRAVDLPRHLPLLLARRLGPGRAFGHDDGRAALRDRAQCDEARPLCRPCGGRRRHRRRAARRRAFDSRRSRTSSCSGRSSCRTTTPSISAASSGTPSAST